MACNLLEIDDRNPINGVYLYKEERDFYTIQDGWVVMTTKRINIDVAGLASGKRAAPFFSTSNRKLSESIATQVQPRWSEACHRKFDVDRDVASDTFFHSKRDADSVFCSSANRSNIPTVHARRSHRHLRRKWRESELARPLYSPLFPPIW